VAGHTAERADVERSRIRMAPLQRTRMKIIAGVVLVLLAIVVSGVAIFSTASVRYRLTIDVKVEGTIKSGSSVMEVAYSTAPQFLCNLGSCGSGVSSVAGSAVTIDLGEKGLLFATLRESSLSNAPDRPICFYEPIACLPFVAYGIAYQSRSDLRATAIRELQSRSGSVEAPSNALPALVRFRDIKDPSSDEEVVAANMAATYGPDVSFARATVELTDAPLTPVPKIWPDWLKSLVDGPSNCLAGSRTDCKDRLGLHNWDFKR
jgi:hypothetical protein